MIRAADILGVPPESVIRLALSEMYLDSGRSLERHITDGPYLRDAYLPDLRASERTNSVSVLKRDRHAGVCSGSVQNPTLRNIFP